MRKLFLTAAALSLLTAASAAQGQTGHAGHADHAGHKHAGHTQASHKHAKKDHSGHDHAAHGAKEANGEAVLTTGTLHKIDGSMFTLTHEPIPQIGWPTMTMDLMLLDGAKVGDVKAGDAVAITLEKGNDGLYHIRAIGPL